MISRELRSYERLTRVHDFGLMHAALFPAESRAGRLFAEISAAVGELTEHTAAQVATRDSAREQAVSKTAARAALHHYVEMINRTARGMSLDKPGLGDKFRMPLGSGDQELLRAARAFHTNAKPLKDDFIENEMPADFLTALAEHIAELEEAISDKHENRQMQVTATAAKEAAFERGLDALRKLDPVMRNKFRDDSITLTAWASASHATHTTRKPSSEPSEPGEPPKPVQP